MDFEEYKSYLVMSVESTADWRARKAAEHPDDERNVDSSRALEALATKLEELPADHPKLRELWNLEFGLQPPSELDEDDVRLFFIKRQSELLRRYGFDAPEDGDPAQFLTDLITAYKEELTP